VGSPARLLALYATPSPVSCSRADTEIASDKRGAVQDQEEPRRSEAGDGRIVCSRRLFLSRLRRNAATTTGLAAAAQPTDNQGAEGEKGTVDGGTARERGKRLDEALGEEKRAEKSKMRRQLNGHQRLVRRRMASSRRQT
jgi:hypothetical protein